MSKIDIIIDALRLGFSRCPAREMGHFEQALAAARELKTLKPVAWAEVWDEYAQKYVLEKLNPATPLYTAPPRKPWQGLTDEDTANICMQGDLNDWHDEQVIDAVEAKLKELNT